KCNRQTVAMDTRQPFGVYTSGLHVGLPGGCAYHGDGMGRPRIEPRARSVTRRWRGLGMLPRIWLGIRAGPFTWIVPEQVGASRYPKNAAALGDLAGRGV